MSEVRVALVAAAAAVDLDEDHPLLVAALARRGIAAAATVWDDREVRWDGFDLAVLRSTWDYPKRRDEFLAWARTTQARTRLRNAAEVVTWNTDKRYLPELAAQGVPIVPTWITPPGCPPALPGDGPFVVKPAVSAGAQDTVRYEPHQREAARRHAARLHAAGRDVVVQPYLTAVDAAGETALVFLGDELSHAIRKGPLLASDVPTVGGLFAEEDIRPRTPSADEVEAAARTLDALPFDRSDLLYARVDLIADADGRPRVLEVELVEPSLFLRHADGAADRFAEVVAAAL